MARNLEHLAEEFASQAAARAMRAAFRNVSTLSLVPSWILHEQTQKNSNSKIQPSE